MYAYICHTSYIHTFVYRYVYIHITHRKHIYSWIHVCIYTSHIIYSCIDVWYIYLTRRMDMYSSIHVWYTYHTSCIPMLSPVALKATSCIFIFTRNICICSCIHIWKCSCIYIYIHTIFHASMMFDMYVYGTYVYMNTYTYVPYIMPALCAQGHLWHIPIYRHICIHRIIWSNKVLLKSNPKPFKSNSGLFWWNLYANKCSLDRILGSFCPI